jgi:hypothetical protein
MKRSNLFLLCATLAALRPAALPAQVVAVTMSLDDSSIVVGEGTTLRVYAQVVPNVRTNADRIFSWYVDVLNTNGVAAVADYGAMLKATSDNYPQTSSNGVSQGSNRVGIYDTFLDLPGAGVSNAVELMAIPVSGAGAGQTRFRVRAGTGVPALSADFLVAPKGGGDPLEGGDYAAAFADLTVIEATPCDIALQIARQTGGTLRVSFTPCAGRNHTVEYRDALNNASTWQALPNAPHNSGLLTVTNLPTQRFFRIRADPL